MGEDEDPIGLGKDLLANVTATPSSLQGRVSIPQVDVSVPEGCPGTPASQGRPGSFGSVLPLTWKKSKESQ